MLVLNITFCIPEEIVLSLRPVSGFLAQLVRATGLHPVGRGFESLGTHTS